jgi:hypothetical protein
MLTDLAEACRKSGLRVVERSGWKTRGYGPMRAVESITCHHDVTPNHLTEGALGYIEANRLSQLTLARDGTVYVVAAGLCYHAGVVHQSWMGNSYAIGIEAAHSGNPRDAWPGVQYAAYVRLVGALSAHYGVPLARVLGHKEVARPTGRKTDPTFDMDEFRRDVRNYLSSAHKADEEEDDMPWNDEVRQDIKRIIAETLRENVGDIAAQDEKSWWRTGQLGLIQAGTTSVLRSEGVSGAGDLGRTIAALAPLVSGDDGNGLSEDDVRRVAEAVQRLDAKAVAEQLAVVSRADA